jgi:hypothetical protein
MSPEQKMYAVFAFYVLLVIILSTVTIVQSTQQRMENSLIAMMAGVLLSYILWILFGKDFVNA